MDDGILALGAENRTAFSFISGKEIVTGAPVDSLKEACNFIKYKNEIEEFLQKEKNKPQFIVCDMHPDYLSTSLAEEFQKKNDGSVLLKVQHHHAHIVACMYDNGIEEEVIGVTFDGTGYGNDGHSWGGEFLVSSKTDFSREYHLSYVLAPGADIVVKEAWRMALAYLRMAYGDNYLRLNIPLLKRIPVEKTSIIDHMMKRKINSPQTSSMGRLFDAVSSILGICDVSRFEAEAAILLENSIEFGITEHYDYDIYESNIDVSQMIKQIVGDMEQGLSSGDISAKFHNTIGEMVYSVSSLIAKKTEIGKVVVSGGCFQNKYLLNYITKRFEHDKLDLFTHKKFSTTDLGISVGQAVIAASIY